MDGHIALSRATTHMTYMTSKNISSASTKIAKEIIQKDADGRDSKQEKIQRFAQQISWIYGTAWHLMDYSYELCF